MKRPQALTAFVLLTMLLSILTLPTVAQEPSATPSSQTLGTASFAPGPASPELSGWRYGPPSPFQYQRFDAVFVPGMPNVPWANRIYFLGGRTSASTELPDIWVFDPVTGVYTDTQTDMIEDVSNYNGNLILDDGTGRGPAIYVIGGYDRDNAAANISLVQRYYPQLNLIESLPPLDDWPGTVAGYAVAGQGTAVVNDMIYVFGGWENITAPYFYTQTWAFDPKQPSGSRWTNLGLTFSPGRCYIQAAVYEGKILAMGGVYQYVGGDLVPTDVVQALDTANLAAGWTERAPLPIPLAEGRGFGPGSDTLRVAGSNAVATVKLPWFLMHVYTAGGGDWPDISREAMEYIPDSDAWDRGFPDLNDRRVNNAGTFVPLYTPDPDDGLPGLWVFGGRSESGCDPPYGATEFYSLPLLSQCNILLVDDDPDQYDGEPFNGTGTYYYTSTLEALDLIYYVRWDVWTQGDPTLADLQSYDAVIWFTGYAREGTITPTNEAALAAYLKGGGNLLVSSEDYLYDQGISSFALRYLGVAGAVQDTGEVDVVGNTGDPLGSGLGPYTLAVPTSWPSGTLDLYTDEVLPGAGVGVPFRYQFSGAGNSTGQDAALWRTVFLAWPLEGLSNLGDRTLVLGRALNWFCFGERVPQMLLLPPAQSGSGVRGAAVTYTVTLINELGFTETFALDYQATWPITGPATIGPLPTGTSQDFMVTVTIPADSNCNDVDTAVVTATSVLSPTVYVDTAVITTSYAVPGNGGLVGTVHDLNTDLGIPGAHVYLTRDGTYTETWADAGGAYRFGDLAACTYVGGADATRYYSASFTVSLQVDLTTTQDIYLPASWPNWFPASFSLTLPASSTGLLTATLANSGTGDLRFAVTEVPTDSGIPWLAVSPTAGLVSPGYSGTIDLLFDTSGLVPGTCHTGTLQVDYNDPYIVQEFVPLGLCVPLECDPVAGVDFDWTPPTPTVGLLVTFTATVADTPTLPVTYTWGFGDGTVLVTTATVVTHAYTASGTYSVSVVAANACGQAPAGDLLTVEIVQWRVYLPLVFRAYGP